MEQRKVRLNIIKTPNSVESSVKSPIKTEPSLKSSVKTGPSLKSPIKIEPSLKSSDEPTSKNLEQNLEPVYAEITAKVVSINAKDKSHFIVYAEKMDKKFNCVYEGFLPIRSGDAISGLCQYKSTKDSDHLSKSNKIQLIFETAPLCQQGSDRDTIKEFFISNLRGGMSITKKSEQIIDILISRSEEKTIEGAIKIMDKLSTYICYSNEIDMSDVNIGLDDPSVPFSQIIDSKTFYKLVKAWYKGRVLRNLYLFGLNNKEINSTKINPLKLYEKINENPYSLTCLNLDKCEKILKQCGKQVDDDFKYCGQIIRKISEMMENNGWTGVPTNMILRMFPDVAKYIQKLKDEFGVVTDMRTVYLNHAYEVETTIAEWIKELLVSNPINILSSIEFTRNDLTNDQKKAIELALRSNVSIITGGGGSGKTLCIKELVHNLERNGIPYRIGSFTGKAVSRIRDVTGKKEPSTLNMMITTGKSSRSNDTKESSRSSENTKETKEGSHNKKSNDFKVLIIDESSMVTTELLYEFRRCFNHSYSIILVGDCNQLQPISFGNLFESLLKTKKIPTTILNYIHRTENSGENGILINSKRIIEYKSENQEEGEEFSFAVTQNFRIMFGDLNTVEKLLVNLTNKSIDSSKIVIISPFNKDLDILNTNSSNLYNGFNRDIVDARGKRWKIGDRVMACSNNYKNNVLTGDEGIVINITDDDKVTVKYRLNTYNYFTSMISEDQDGSKELNTEQLVLSFAISTHRSQGSEYDYVIGYIPEGNPSSTFLNANLLYTLITRAKKGVWLIGDIATMERAAITRPAYRCENLAQRILTE